MPLDEQRVGEAADQRVEHLGVVPLTTTPGRVVLLACCRWPPRCRCGARRTRELVSG